MPELGILPTQVDFSPSSEARTKPYIDQTSDTVSDITTVYILLCLHDIDI